MSDSPLLLGSDSSIPAAGVILVDCANEVYLLNMIILFTPLI